MNAPKPAPELAVTEDAAKLNQFLLHGCATEPIHRLGSVQSHGFLLVASRETLRIVQLTQGFLNQYSGDLTAEAVIGSPLANWLDADPDALRDLLNGVGKGRPTLVELELAQTPFGSESDTHTLKSPDTRFECSVHLSGDHWVIEWVPIGGSVILDFTQLEQLRSVNRTLSELRRTSNINDFYRGAVEAIQEMTGYDRVMFYKFLPDWSGDVIAEAVSSRTTQRFVGMRFPASDIPAQARELYVLNSLRAVADIESTPDHLIPSLLPNGEPLDQSFSILRSMSSAHIKYLQNMGVRATMSVSLIRNGQLWGLIACHHNATRTPPYHMREMLQATCEMISNVITMRTDDLSRLAQEIKSNAFSETLNKLKNSIGDHGDVSLGCQSVSANLLETFKAFQWGIQVNESHSEIFETEQALNQQSKERAPNSKAIFEQLTALLDEHPIDTPLAIRNLKEVHPELAKMTGAAGILAIRFGTLGRNHCYFARTEEKDTIHWGGKPEKAVVRTQDGAIYMEPRRSFDLWVETVDGLSADWDEGNTNFLTRLSYTVAESVNEVTNKRLSETLKWRARHDHLTGLLNRSTLDVEVEESIKARQPFSIFMVDMDNFKRINDTLGHRVGDEVIRETGRRLASVTRSGDLAARYGGDEFLLVIRYVQEEMNAPELVAERLRKVMKVPFLLDNQSLEIGLSIGVAHYPMHGTDLTTLMRHADIAMYDAKSSGKGQIVTFSDEMDNRAQQEFILETELRSAIPSGELRLYYQPKLSLETNKVTGLEALVRWQHPKRGLLDPSVFIPIAERTNLIREMGKWVMEEACAQIAKWRLAGYEAKPIAVNVSMAQFADQQFLENIADCLDRYEIPAELFEIELTETVLMENTALAISILQKLSQRGVHITLDDFGTGYSSLSYLHQLPFDTLKIDRAFISNLETDEEAKIVTTSVLGLAAGLCIQTVAEGVESQAQMDWLREKGCQDVQGYFLSPPVPLEMVWKTIKRLERS